MGFEFSPFGDLHIMKLSFFFYFSLLSFLKFSQSYVWTAYHFAPPLFSSFFSLFFFSFNKLPLFFLLIPSLSLNLLNSCCFSSFLLSIFLKCYSRIFENIFSFILFVVCSIIFSNSYSSYIFFYSHLRSCIYHRACVLISQL